MAKKPDPKREALDKDGALNPHPEAIRDAVFTGNPFFDAKDLVQARYEMVRRHRVDGVAISEASTNFGVSRPTFYKAQKALQRAGLPGLLPSQRGPKGSHKISTEVVAFAVELRAANPQLTTSQCLVEIATKFGVKVHRRSLERALARKKNESIRVEQRYHRRRGRRLREAARCCAPSPSVVKVLGSFTVKASRRGSDPSHNSLLFRMPFAATIHPDARSRRINRKEPASLHTASPILLCP
jgi:transposase